MSALNFFLCVLGLVMVVEGVPYFAFPERMKSMMRKILETPDSTLRGIGIVIMSIGLCLIYIGKN